MKIMFRHRAGFLASVVLVLSMVSSAHASRVCEVRAMGDGHMKDSAAIQEAIDSCAAHGGGTVHFAAGACLFVPIDWKSHVRLELDAGAIPQGLPEISDYPVRDNAAWRRVSLLHAGHGTDSALNGSGFVDGKGQDFTIEHMTATGARREAEIYGLPESPIRHLVLRNVPLSGETGADMQDAQIHASDFTVKAATGESLHKGPGVELEMK